MIKDDPFGAIPPMRPEMDITEQFGAMNFNQPLSSEEEQKSQANIDNILGVFDNKEAPKVEPKEIDTSNLFNFVGMDTNRTENTFDASIQPNLAG